ncbi:MAG: hypothetical protein ACK4S4_07465 [Pyrinomonadaceae bacterium]
MNDTAISVTPLRASARTLLNGAIDYAGLFPPSQLSMADAVTNYALNRASVHSWMLGRFVVPAARLAEFREHAEPYVANPGRSPWHLSVLAGEDVYESIKTIVDFNRDNAGQVIADSFEVRASTPSKIENTVDALPDWLIAYFELPIDAPHFAELISTVAVNKQRAKIRTGGVTADAFPRSRDVIRFVRTCTAANVPFKATAGLHHPIRCFKPLTYEPDAPQGTMHGFLNLFLMTAFARQSFPPGLLEELMEEEFEEAFSFSDTHVAWRDHELALWQLERTRRFGIQSFGSCSFEEPVEDLKALGLL